MATDTGVKTIVKHRDLNVSVYNCKLFTTAALVVSSIQSDEHFLNELLSSHDNKMSENSELWSEFSRAYWTSSNCPANSPKFKGIQFTKI